MQKTKKILAVVLCFALLVVNGITVNASTAPSSWAVDQVNKAIAENFVPQNLQSNYTQATTRAEFATLAVNLYEKIKGEIAERSTFIDTGDVNVQKAAAIGIVSGVGNNRFDPDGTLTREQAATMLSRLSHSMERPLPIQASTFADSDSIASWAIEGVGGVQSTGIMSGVGDNMFAPQQQYTREQSIITIIRLYYNLEIEMLNNTKQNITNTEEAVAAPLPKSELTSNIQPKESWTEITIEGDEIFTRNTEQALALIKEKSEVGHETVIKYVGIIRQETFSGMRAYDKPPTYQVAEATYTASTTWYASTIIHDAYHSKLYNDYLDIHGGSVPNDVWTGEQAEAECLEFQISFLEEINAPTHEIEYSKSLRGTNWWDIPRWW